MGTLISLMDVIIARLVMDGIALEKTFLVLLRAGME